MAGRWSLQARDAATLDPMSNMVLAAAFW